MIRIGIVGYGNLAKGVECAIAQNPDIGALTIATRRIFIIPYPAQFVKRKV